MPTLHKRMKKSIAPVLLLSVFMNALPINAEMGDNINHDIPVSPGHNAPSIKKINEPDLDHVVNATFSPSSNFKIVSINAPAGWGSGPVYSHIYNAGEGQYSAEFTGELVPVGEGGGQGEPTTYEFDVEVEGWSFFIEPPENIKVPVPASANEFAPYIAKKDGNMVMANWTWISPNMPEDSSPNGVDEVIYNAYCLEAGTYTLQASHDGASDTKQYIPTGVQRLYVEDVDDSSNSAETVWPLSTTMPIVAGSQHPDIETDVLYLPYTETEEGISDTKVKLQATPFPSPFPDDQTLPNWTLLDENENVLDNLASYDGIPSPAEPYTFSSPGTYIFKAECGNELEVKIFVYTVESLLPDQGVEIDDKDGDDNTKVFVVQYADSGVVTVKATSNPVIAEEDLPDEWVLTGGTGTSKLARTIDKTTTSKKVLTCTNGCVTKTTTIYVYYAWLQLFADEGAYPIDYGHSWWRFAVNPQATELLTTDFNDDDLHYFVNKSMGFWPVGMDKTIITAPGAVYLGDQGHQATGYHDFEITFDKLVDGLQYAFDLEDSPGSFDWFTRNCTDEACYTSSHAGVSTISTSGLTKPSDLSDWLNEQ